MGYKIYKETLVYMSLRDLISFLGMLGDNFEYKNRQLIHKTEEYNTDYYTKHIEEYYLPDCFKFENISINI